MSNKTIERKKFRNSETEDFIILKDNKLRNRSRQRNNKQRRRDYETSVSGLLYLGE